MSAGRGIIHSEMPTQDSSGLHGFQLWFNLPARRENGAPRYRDLPRALLAQATIWGPATRAWAACCCAAAPCANPWCITARSL
jgi:redox-sensitive bicupin YhaK (pirin superfamily)